MSVESPQVMKSGSATARRARKTAAPPVSRLAYAPALAIVALLFLSWLLYGATRPVAALYLSGGLIVAALASLAFAGPRYVTSGMLIGGAAIWAIAGASATFAGAGAAAGSVADAAAAPLAVLFAAGAVWTAGHTAARRPAVLNAAWTAVLWSALAACLWHFLLRLLQTLTTAAAPSAFTASFDSAPSAALLFSLLSLIGASRVLHVIKQMDAEALSRSAMVDRLFRDGLGGLLLSGFAFTCLILTGSTVALLLFGAAVLTLVWWDTRAIVNRDHRSRWVRWLARLAPWAATAAAVLGVCLSVIHDESIARNTAGAPPYPVLQRLQVYVDAWLQRPFFGHGPGSLGDVRDRAMTLANVQALSVSGGARNVFLHWLVELGLVGTLAVLAGLGAIHAAIVSGLGSKRTSRTFLRLALCASLLMILHGVSDSSLDIPGVAWLYALLLGIACGVSAIGRQTDPERPG